MESPQTARSTYIAKCGAKVQGLDPLWQHNETCPTCSTTDEEAARRFEIVCAHSGDRAEADSAKAALTAAAQLVIDHADHVGAQGAAKAARASLYITENGTYSGILTAFARQGARL